MILIIVCILFLISIQMDYNSYLCTPRFERFNSVYLTFDDNYVHLALLGAGQKPVHCRSK